MQNNIKLKGWLVDNGWAIIVYIIGLVVAAVSIYGKVDVNAAEIDENKGIMDMHVIRIDGDMNDQDDVDGEILQRLERIETGQKKTNELLQLVIDGKVKLGN